MTHFGIICPTGSNLTHGFALANELQERGHRVTFLNILDVQEKVISSGFGFRAIGESERPIGSNAWIWSTRGKLTGLKALRFSLKTALEDMQVLLRDAPDIIRSERIEALLVNQSSPGGGTIADHLSIPFISICSALPLNRELGIPPVFTHWKYHDAQISKMRNWAAYRMADWLVSPISKVIEEYRSMWKLKPYGCWDDNFSPLAQISHQPAEFEFPRRNLPAHFQFTGPYLNRSVIQTEAHFPWERLTGQPLIYASMGTIQNQVAAVFQMIAEACVDLNAQLVISLGGGISPEAAPKLAGQPLVVNYAPQLEILKKAALSITHAGLNTTLESLANGVPLVAIPIANDQPGVAARIEWVGVGERVPISHLGIEQLRKVIKSVLSDSSYATRASLIQNACESSGGVKKAIDIIESVIATSKPFVEGGRDIRKAP